MAKPKSSDAQSTIAEHANTCLGLMRALVEQLDGSALNLNADDELGRFNLWTSNIGVFASPHACLDYRVRDASGIADAFKSFLRALETYIERALAHCRPRPRHLSQALRSFKTRTSPKSEPLGLEHRLQDIHNAISRLHSLSLVMRKLGARNPLSKTAGFVIWDEIDGCKVDVSDKFDTFVHHVVMAREPALKEQLFLADRLISSICLRRRKFLYAQEHQLKLQSMPVAKARKAQGSATRPAFLSKLSLQTSMRNNSAETRSVATAATSKSGTTASGFHPPPNLPIKYAETEVTSAPSTTASVMEKVAVEYPPPPGLSSTASELACPYCRLVFPREKMCSRKWWKVHVQQDLEPYVCIFEKCSGEKEMFGSVKEWLSHMKKHGRKWVCPVSSCQSATDGAFEDRETFSEHMHSAHGDKYNEDQIQLLADNCTRQRDVLQICPFCGYQSSQQEHNAQTTAPSKTQRHIARHLLAVSLLSLPWRDDVDDTLLKSNADAGSQKTTDDIEDMPSVRDDDSADSTSCEPITWASSHRRCKYYKVAVLTALPSEMVAVRAMLDEVHDAPEDYSSDTDEYSYLWGRMSGHNVVAVSLATGTYGKASAAVAATQLALNFSSIRIFILVGIGAGVPDPENGSDIRLGDVVVSRTTGLSNGVVQMDFGRLSAEGFRRTGSTSTPPTVLLSTVDTLRAQHRIRRSRIPAIIDETFERFPNLADSTEGYGYPGAEKDRLFAASYKHVGESSTCDTCSADQSILRSPRPEPKVPNVHYGMIAADNRVVKDGLQRNKIADELEKVFGFRCLCIDMEAAGLMNDFPCLVVRGISDYADSHKNTEWQGYAAFTAAAYTKELLSTIPVAQIKAAEKYRQMVESISDMRTYTS